MPAALKILFFCRHNSVRAPLAAALAESIAGPRVEAFSAGLEFSRMSPEIETFIYDLTGKAPKTAADLSTLSNKGIGLIVVLGDKSHPSSATDMHLDEQFGDAEIVAWDMPEPSTADDIKHTEIELAERMRLMFQARHLI